MCRGDFLDKEKENVLMAELCALYSGSTGNSYFIGSKTSGVLVDIGRSAKQTTNILKRCEIDPLAINWN